MKYGTGEGGNHQSKMKNKEVMKSEITFIKTHSLLKKGRKIVSHYIKKRSDNTENNLKPEGRIRVYVQTC